MAEAKNYIQSYYVDEKPREGNEEGPKSPTEDATGFFYITISNKG